MTFYADQSLFSWKHLAWLQESKIVWKENYSYESTITRKSNRAKERLRYWKYVHTMFFVKQNSYTVLCYLVQIISYLIPCLDFFKDPTKKLSKFEFSLNFLDIDWFFSAVSHSKNLGVKIQMCLAICPTTIHPHF